MEYKNRKTSHNSLAEPILKKHVGLIHCENKLTLIQRKICNILLFNALDKINEQDIHEISMKKLCSLVGYNSNDIKLIKKSLKGLISVVMEWNLLADNKFIREVNLPGEELTWHASSLLAGASLEKGLIRYSYSPQIKTVLTSLEIYGRINLFVQAKFNSSYSLVLYENCVRFKSIEQTSWLSLKLFRTLMGIAENKYVLFKELNRNVISVAMQEINQKTDIFIEIEYKRVGRQITALKFFVRDNEKYQPSFKKVKKLEVTVDESQITSPDLGEILSNEFNFNSNQVKEILENYSRDYIQEKINLVKNQTKVRNRMAYLMAALNDNYHPQKTLIALKNEKENNYLRELKEASEISSLRKKYSEYKFKFYMTYLRKLEKLQQEKILNDFERQLKSNITLFNIYQKKGFNSGLLRLEYINFFEKMVFEEKGKPLTFDEYLTSEESEVV